MYPRVNFRRKRKMERENSYSQRERVREKREKDTNHLCGPVNAQLSQDIA